jgi:tripartite-type tricarboxylate transporter receptor subunit TctC
MGRLPRVVAVALVTSLQCIGPVLSQDWPTRPVTMVVPFAAGGPADTVGRILASSLSELLGQQVIIENVGGSGGMTGSARVAKAAPDGYQFVLGNVGTHAANQTFYKTPLYNAATDFAPVMLIAQTPLVLLARKDLPANNLKEFIAYAKANQASMQYGSGGAGSASHLACVLLNAAIGINVTHVPYRGAAPAMQDLIAGRIDYQCPDTPIAIPQIQSKMVKAIAILTRDRSPSLPSQASAHEQGLTNFDASNWFASFFPKERPRRSSTSFMPPRSRPSTRSQCRRGCGRSAPTWSRASAARPIICKNSSRPRLKNGPGRSRLAGYRWIE